MNNFYKTDYSFLLYERLELARTAREIYLLGNSDEPCFPDVYYGRAADEAGYWSQKLNTNVSYTIPEDIFFVIEKQEKYWFVISGEKIGWIIVHSEERDLEKL